MSLGTNPSPVAEDPEPTIFENVSAEGEITVLAVDDDPQLLDLTETFLEKERSEFDVVTAELAGRGLDILADRQIDAVVSDYEMQEMDGLSFLERVRADHGNIPFILFTGKGSEDIASEAISKGVTDYLQKSTGASQYSLLANRLVNAVEKYEAARYVKRSQEKFSKLVKNSSDMVGIVNESGEFEYISPACEHVLGYTQDELVGENAFHFMPQSDRKRAMEDFFEAIEQPDKQPIIEHGFEADDGTIVQMETRGQNMFGDDFINGFVVNGRDITSLKERETKLKQQNELLTDVRHIVAHDIRGPVDVISDSLELYRETGDGSYLTTIADSTGRIRRLIDQLLRLADRETTIEETGHLTLHDVARDAWQLVDSDGAELHIENSKEFEADRDSLTLVFENLFQNAVEHNDQSVVVTIGSTADGIFVEDDGRGIPRDDRENVFDSGFTPGESSTGFGLNIANQVVIGHGWEIDVTDGRDGGARFDITGVSFKPTVYD